jgi:hypothetical protein
MVEEDERPDHLPLAMRQRAAHRKAVAEIAGARHDDQIERVAGLGIAKFGIGRGLPAHGISPLDVVWIILSIRRPGFRRDEFICGLRHNLRNWRASWFP